MEVEFGAEMPDAILLVNPGQSLSMNLDVQMIHDPLTPLIEIVGHELLKDRSAENVRQLCLIKESLPLLCIPVLHEPVVVGFVETANGVDRLRRHPHNLGYIRTFVKDPVAGA